MIFVKIFFPYNIFVSSTFIVNYINHTNTFIENQSCYVKFKKNAKYWGKKKIIRKMIFLYLIYSTKWKSNISKISLKIIYS